MLYTLKYTPKKLDEILGNREKIDYIRQWILQIINGKKRKPLLVYGPPGTGKTSIAYAISLEYDFDIIEMNASELRDKKRVVRILGSAGLASSLFGQGKIILIDDADILAGRADYGGAGAIKSVLAESPYPIIVTATDIWDQKFAPLRSECEKIELKKVSKISIRQLLHEIAKSESIDVSGQKIDEISENAEGDVRAALNDLQSMHSSSRNKEKDIFNVVRSIFKAKSYKEAKEAVSGDIDYELIKLWIDENIPNEYESAEDIAAAFNYLSKGDIFDGRIKKTYWKLLKYSIDLSTAGVALAKKGTYHKFTKYSFPGYLSNMSRTVQSRAMLKSIGRKIGPMLHVNSKKARDYFPVLKELGKEHYGEIMNYYKLDESEMAFILGTSVMKSRK
ncbi:replication factor C large subunit [Candidatus Micrarchaeota archaeon]|nr:replication factor C large subunit [Candidatus Micrarchaeota archaeon]